MIRGLVQVQLRGGGTVHVAAEVEDEPAVQKLLAELAEDVNRGSVDPGILHEQATRLEAEAHFAKISAYQHDDLFQLRPGLWVRRREVIGIGFVATE